MIFVTFGWALIKICLVGCEKILCGVVVLLGKVRRASYAWNCAQDPKSETKRFVCGYLGMDLRDFWLCHRLHVYVSLVAFVSRPQTVC